MGPDCGQPARGQGRQVGWQAGGICFPYVFNFEAPARRVIVHVADDDDRGGVPLEIRIFLKLAGKLHLAMRLHADFLAQFAKRSLDRCFALLAAASRQSPSLGITESHEDQSSLGGQRDAVRTEGLRTANEPAKLQKAVRGGRKDVQKLVGYFRHHAQTRSVAVRSSTLSRTPQKPPCSLHMHPLDHLVLEAFRAAAERLH